MKIRPLAVGALALVLPLAAVACGGEDDNNSGTRPTVAELTKDLEKSTGLAGQPNGDAYIACTAKKLHESDLPNGVLRKYVKNEESSIDKDNEAKYTKIVTDINRSCAAEAQAAATGE